MTEEREKCAALSILSDNMDTSCSDGELNRQSFSKTFLFKLFSVSTDDTDLML